ncbi:MAG: hypothetical protein LBH98_08125 [Chitinispirillales bacterium]|jgi:hypothetical protein|nr:hypothetical protein [Chitinispirillales bacterium]
MLQKLQNKLEFAGGGGLTLTLIIFCAFAANVWAVSCGEAPKEPGAALIIYNGAGMGLEFSNPAMQTFRAALSGDERHITYSTHENGNLVYDKTDGIPKIDPPLTLVDTLNVTVQGMDSDLKKTFYGKDPLFDSLYDAGNPLTYWSQVYDLRFRNILAGGAEASITTNLNQKTSDASYFRVFLQSGGALYLQTVRGEFTTRNAGVEFVIKNFTLDKNYTNTKNPISSPDGGNFSFTDNYDFKCNFNDLKDENDKHPMNWAMPGGYPSGEIVHGKPLAKNLTANSDVIVAWKTGEMDPIIGNGILIVGWAITAWGPQSSGGNSSVISRATFATIQNIYALMTQTAMYSINKSFSQDGSIIEKEDGETGTCYITLKNNAIYKVGPIVVRDTLSKCLEYIDKSDDKYDPKPYVTYLPSGKTELIWTDLVLPNNRGVLPLQFDYKVKFTPPCSD